MVPSIHSACLHPGSEIVVHTGIKAVEKIGILLYVQGQKSSCMIVIELMPLRQSACILWKRSKGYIRYSWLVAYITHYFQAEAACIPSPLSRCCDFALRVEPLEFAGDYGAVVPSVAVLLGLDWIVGGHGLVALCL